MADSNEVASRDKTEDDLENMHDKEVAGDSKIFDEIDTKRFSGQNEPSGIIEPEKNVENIKNSDSRKSTSSDSKPESLEPDAVDASSKTVPVVSKPSHDELEQMKTDETDK